MTRSEIWVEQPQFQQTKDEQSRVIITKAIGSAAIYASHGICQPVSWDRWEGRILYAAFQGSARPAASPILTHLSSTSWAENANGQMGQIDFESMLDRPGIVSANQVREDW